VRRLSSALLFMSIAIRNLWRSRRRSAITMLSIGVGTITLVLLSGYILVMDGGLKSNTIEKETGYFQIARKGYFEDDALSLDRTLDDPECAAIEEWLYSQPEITSLTRRLQIVGMIGNSKKSAVFAGICDTSGSLVSMVPTILEGSTLSAEDPEGIVVGKRLAEKLGAKLGDPLLVFVSTSSGAPEAVAARIRGIYKGLMAEQEGMIVYMPIETAWSLMLERRSQRIIGFADRLEDLPALATRTRAWLAAKRPDLELKLWDELALMYRQIIGMFSSLVAVAGAIIFLVIVFGISNTMYMAIHDRTHEIGTMRAIGKTKGYIVGLFFAEGLFLGLFGALFGTAVSLGLIPLINGLNITFPPGPGQVDRIPLVIQGDLGLIALVMLVNVVCAALASILPSWKASRQRIADALRFS
jgi:putative ABC transport system permease protein